MYRFRIRNGTANIFVMVEPKAGLRYAEKEKEKGRLLIIEKLVDIYKVNKIHNT